MLSRRIVQAAVEEIHGYFKLTIAVTDSAGKLLATAGSGPELPKQDVLKTFADSNRQVDQTAGWILIRITEWDKPVLIAAVEAQGRDRLEIVGISLAFSLLLRQKRDQFGRDEFFRNLLTGSLLPTQIKGAAYEIGIPERKPRMVYVISLPADKNPAAADDICNRLSEQFNDTIIVSEERTIALVHEPEPRRRNETGGDDEFEQRLLEAIHCICGGTALVGCGKTARDLGSLPDSYRKALSAIKTGRAFRIRNRILRYSDLLFESFVRHMPICDCEHFWHESFNEEFFMNMDEETAKTAQVFLKNTMNRTQTSKELFFHRNTLNYRLTNIRGESGLDLKDFRDAMLFRLGWTIFRYIQEYNIDN